MSNTTGTTGLNADGTQASGGSTTQTQGAATITFTPEQQKAIDAITGNIRKEAKASGEAAGVESLLKSMGFEKPEQLQSAIAEFKKVTDAQKSEAQKLADRNAELEKQAADEKTKREAAEARANEKLLRAAVLTEVNTAGIDPAEHESVWLLIKNDAALRDAIKPKGDDAFEGVDTVVKKIAEAHPRWLKAEPQGDGVGTGKPSRRKLDANTDGDKQRQEQSRRSYAGKW